MKIKRLGIITAIILVLAVLLIVPVLGWSTNQFNNSLKSEILTFGMNTNQTRFLAVPSAVFKVKDGYLNLTGSFPPQLNVTEKHNIEMGQLAGGGELGGEKFIVGATPILLNSVEIGDSCTATKAYLYNEEKEWNIQNATFVGAIAVFSPSVRLNPNSTYYLLVGNDGAYMQINFTSTHPPNYPIQGAYINWTSAGYITSPDNPAQVMNIWSINVSNSTRADITIANSPAWNYTVSQNTTTNLSSIINTYLTSTYLVGSNYLIPFIFHADSAGTLEYFNLSFNNQAFIENSQSYVTDTFEGSTNAFSINVSLDQFNTNFVGYLVYNQTIYTGVRYDYGNDFIFNASVTAPLITVDTNQSFYWTIGLINATGTTYYNSTIYNQTVRNQNISDCSSNNNLVLNYTMKDELTQLAFNSTLYNGSIELNVQIYSLVGNTLVFNYSKMYNLTNNAKLCLAKGLTNSSQYRMFVETKYYADSYATRYNYIQNYSMTNSTIPQNIDLFILSSSVAKKFLMTYKDSSLATVSGALISINRQYIYENVYKTVEIEKTNLAGQAWGQFDLSAKYQIVVSKNGVILTTFDNVIAYCTNEIVGECTLSLDASSALSSNLNFYTYSGMTFGQKFNQTSRIYSITFATNDNSVSLIMINLTRDDNYGNLSLCSNSVTTSSGTLTCTIPASYNNVTFIATIYKDGTAVAHSTFSISAKAVSVFVGNVAFFAFALILTLGSMLVPSPIGLLIGGLIGLASTVYLLAVSGSKFMGGSLIILTILAAIVIWRLRQGGND